MTSLPDGSVTRTSRSKKVSTPEMSMMASRLLGIKKEGYRTHNCRTIKSLEITMSAS